jgi:hypothetical protein
MPGRLLLCPVKAIFNCDRHRQRALRSISSRRRAPLAPPPVVRWLLRGVSAWYRKDLTPPPSLIPLLATCRCGTMMRRGTSFGQSAGNCGWAGTILTDTMQNWVQVVRRQRWAVLLFGREFHAGSASVQGSGTAKWMHGFRGTTRLNSTNLSGTEAQGAREAKAHLSWSTIMPQDHKCLPRLRKSTSVSGNEALMTAAQTNSRCSQRHTVSLCDAKLDKRRVNVPKTLDSVENTTEYRFHINCRWGDRHPPSLQAGPTTHALDLLVTCLKTHAAHS